MPRSTFLSGRDATIRSFQDGKEIAPLSANSWNIKPSTTKYRDGVNGEKRVRTGAQVDFYDVTIKCFVDNMNQVDTILQDIQNEDAHAVALDKSLLVQIFPKDGTKKAYGLIDAVFEEFEIDNSGNQQRIGLTLMYTADDYKPIATL